MPVELLPQCTRPSMVISTTAMEQHSLRPDRLLAYPLVRLSPIPGNMQLAGQHQARVRQCTLMVVTRPLAILELAMQPGSRSSLLATMARGITTKGGLN